MIAAKLARTVKAVTLVLGLGIGQAHAACPANVEWVRNDSKAAIDAYSSGDMVGFAQSVSALKEDLECLTEPIGSEELETAYLAFALKGVADDDNALAVSNFRSVLVHDPEYLPDDAIAPLDSPARAAFEEAKGLGPGATNQVPETPGYTWVMDGKESATPMLPAERAVVAQLEAADGSITKSEYLPQGGMPEQLIGATQVVVGAVVLPGKKDTERMSGEKPISRTIAMAAGGTAVVAAGTLLTAAIIKGNYLNAPPDDGLLEGSLTANRVLGYSGYGLTGAAVGLGVTAVVVGRW